MVAYLHSTNCICKRIGDLDRLSVRTKRWLNDSELLKEGLSKT